VTTAGPDVSARLAWPDDAAAIARIQQTAWSLEFADLGDADHVETDTLIERWATLISRPPEARVRVFVALERNTVRGYALIHPSYDPDSDQGADGEIAELTIDPDHRRAGHGSRLLQAIADTMRADGFDRIVWWVEGRDDARRAFATSAGWGPDGAHRELEAASGARLAQVRLHTRLRS